MFFSISLHKAEKFIAICIDKQCRLTQPDLDTLYEVRLTVYEKVLMGFHAHLALGCFSQNSSHFRFAASLISM